MTADLNVKPDGLDSIGARTDCAKGDDHPDAAEQDRFVSGAELGDGTPRKDKLMQQAHIGPKPGAVSERPSGGASARRSSSRCTKDPRSLPSASSTSAGIPVSRVVEAIAVAHD